MIQYIECGPHINMIDGVPAFNAGEWPGIKSNKFPKTKRIIHIKKSYNFSLGDTFLNKSRKKRIIPVLKEEEFPIKSKTKRIMSSTLYNKLKDKKKNDNLFFTPLENYNRLNIKKEYDFEKRAKFYKIIQNKFDNQKKKNDLKNKINSLGSYTHDNNHKKEFKEQFYEKVNNNKILGITLTKDLYNQYKKNFDKNRRYNSQSGSHRNQSKFNSKKLLNDKPKYLKKMIEQAKLQYDIEYVASLDGNANTNKIFKH
jgi:hypothetical protein